MVAKFFAYQTNDGEETVIKLEGEFKKQQSLCY